MKTISVMIVGEERTFKVLPETSGCMGCVARENTSLCHQLNTFGCSRDMTIFEEISSVNSYTIDQITAAWKATWGGEPGESFFRSLDKVCDPEYNEYKRLQSKFEV